MTGDSDFSEGAFLQSVMPTFGIGQEVRRPRHQLDGLGRFAFSASAHLTEASPLNSAASSLALAREWGYYWNLSRRVLLEKTPSNMLTSRLLQALFAPAAQFIFISRHPIAVALAHQRWRDCKKDPLSQLTLHWVVSHLILAHDRPHLAAATMLRYEDLVADLEGCISEVWTWLGLPPTLEPLPALSVMPDTNLKYEADYCTNHLSSPAQRKAHCATGAALQPAIDGLGLGYDVLHGDGHGGFRCIRDVLTLSELHGEWEANSSLGLADRDGDNDGGAPRGRACAGVEPDEALVASVRGVQARHTGCTAAGCSTPPEAYGIAPNATSVREGSGELLCRLRTAH